MGSRKRNTPFTASARSKSPPVRTRAEARRASRADQKRCGLAAAGIGDVSSRGRSARAQAGRISALSGGPAMARPQLQDSALPQQLPACAVL